MFLEDDDGARTGVWAVLGITVLLLAGVIGGVVVRSVHQRTAAASVASAPASAEAAADKLLDELLDMPLAGEVVGKVYFASGEAALPPEGNAVLDQAAAALKGAEGKRLILSGFHDASGDPVRNAELAKERAKAVRDALVTRGADAQRIGLRKPEVTTGGGNAEEARRVELRLVEPN
ncbi:MAG: OmpA family protein [Burkholderiales bacterium]